MIIDCMDFIDDKEKRKDRGRLSCRLGCGAGEQNRIIMGFYQR